MRIVEIIPTSVILLLMIIVFDQCKKESNPELPPATTRGAMTFGCLVDGKVFVPRDGRGQSGLLSQYVYDGPGPGRGWYLSITATD